MDLKVIASLLHETMTNAGWFDDADENFFAIRQWGDDKSDAAVLREMDRVNAGIEFINTHTDSNMRLFTEEEVLEWSKEDDSRLV